MNHKNNDFLELKIFKVSSSTGESKDSEKNKLDERC